MSNGNRDVALSETQLSDPSSSVSTINIPDCNMVEKTESRSEKSFLVDFNGPNDPDKPINFSTAKKCAAVGLTAACTFCISFASSIMSASTTATAAEFHVDEEVMILSVSLYVLGFGFGPLLWGPLSERFGRRYPILGGLTVFVIFQIPLAVAQNLQTIFLSRFFAGLFGAAPLGITTSSYVDLLNVVDRGVATSIFAAAVFLGPVFGPIIGSFVTQSYLGWRWTAWITLIISGICTGLSILFVPETSVPVILQAKARRKRLETKEWAWHAKLDESPPTFKSIVQKYIFKPWRMLSSEPILMATTLYISVVYALLYLIFFSYPIAFEKTRGWKPALASLPFISLMLGVFVACIGMAIDSRTRFAKQVRSHGKLVPEDRLGPMIAGGTCLPIGLFWFAWTSSPHITFWPQLVSGIFIGAGITSVFFSGLLYIVDVYLASSASALAANAFFRSICAAASPLFVTYMYRSLGVAWATSLLAFICTALVPIPVLFYFYGHRLRERGSFTSKTP